MHELGFIHGRFQPLHLDHEAYLLEGFRRARSLIIGITNPDPGHSPASAADPMRSRPEANPFSYYQRLLMLEAALDARGIERSRWRVVPFPVLEPEVWPHYVPDEAVFFLSIYDAWGEEKLALFQSHGRAAEVIRRVGPDEKGLSATELRRRMRTGENWAELLSSAVAELILRKGWQI